MRSSTLSQPLTTARRFRLRPVLILIALIAMVTGGYLAYARYSAPAAAPVAVGPTIPVRRGTVAATVTTSGNVVAARQARLTLAASGRLKELTVQLGDRVAEGQVLAKLDATQLELKLAQAESNLRTANLKLEQFKAGPRAEEIAQARAALESARAKLDDIAGGPQAADLVAAQSAHDSAQANVRSAQAKLSQLQSGPTAADVAAAEQSVASARSSLQKAQTDLERVKAGATADELAAATLAVDQAKNSLWSTQIDRDATCGRDKGAGCQSSNARVAAQETSLQQAQIKLEALQLKADPKDVANAESAVVAATESLRSAEARLAQVKSGATSSDIQAAQSSLDAARASTQSAAAKLEQVKSGARATDLSQAQSSVVQAEAALALKQATPTAADLGIYEEAIKQAEIAVQQAKNDLENASLVAPFAGVVGAIQVNVGEAVGANAAVMTLVDPKATRVDVTVDENDIGKVQLGKPAQITFDARPGDRLRARVIGIAPSAVIQQGVATYTVSLSIEEPDVELPAGLTANVSIISDQRDDVLLVPNRAIRRQGRNQMVEILVDGKTESRQVRTGLSNDQVTEVVEGLQDGEMVVMPITRTAAPRVGGGFGGGGFGGPPPGAGPAQPVIVTKPQGGR